MFKLHTNVEGNTPLNNETPHTTTNDVSPQSLPYYLHFANHPEAVLGSTSPTSDKYITWK
jgi:hypothetical protein